MNYTIKINLEEKEKEAINVLAQIYEQCAMDDRLECEDCPFHITSELYSCLPHIAHFFKEKKGEQL